MHNGNVGQGLEAILARADATAALPRLGGMARPNGVVIVSERYWAFAGKDGSLREGAARSAFRVKKLSGTRSA